MKIETSRKLQQEELDLAAANGRYSVLCALAAAVAFGFGSVWIPGMLLVVAGHFLLSYIQHRSTAKRYSLPAESELPTSEDDPAPIFQTTIEVGGSVEALKIRAFGEKPAVSECFDLIMARVSSDPERFDRAYVQLKEQGFTRYPHWRSEIASIEIEALDIFPGKRCRAMVVFSGDANDMWICDSDGISFGDLVRR